MVQINTQKKGKIVTNHAVQRYCERVLKVNFSTIDKNMIEKIRKSIKNMIDDIYFDPTMIRISINLHDNFYAKMKDGKVITIIEKCHNDEYEPDEPDWEVHYKWKNRRRKK